MKCDMYSLKYGETVVDYTLFYADRKTMEMAVHPDGSVVITAPLGTALHAIEQKLLRRARWIVKQLKYFNQFNPRTPKRMYVGGETHLYLGKQYRLKIVCESSKGVKLIGGLFRVSCEKENTPVVIKKLMDDWYAAKAVIHFTVRLNRCWPAFEKHGFHKPRLQIKHMKRRWGSLSGSGIVTLNTELIKAPKECIDYVVTHELSHLKHHDHSTAFYKLLETVIPNWERLKHKLEIALV